MMARPRAPAERLPRPVPVRVVAGFLLALSLAAPAQAALLPPGFFDMKVSPGQGAAAVEADRMVFNAATDVITAEGDVLLSYGGMVIRADRIEFNQRTGELRAIGNVAVKDATGDIYEMTELEVTGEMKEAFLRSMTLTTSTGAVITASDVHYVSELTTILTDASYSPCGLCVDTQGRKIGWKVKSARLIYDRKSASVVLEQPTLELLGVPVAWLPWFWAPDPSQPRATGLRMPSADYSEDLGAQLTVPFFVPVGEDVDLIFSPTLLSRQGFLARGDLSWRVPEFNGVIDVRASGIYQLDRSAFAGEVGDRDWRGAIQTSGTFRPVKDWTVGWSYSVFTDNNFLKDYGLTTADSSINQAYATYLTADTWFDARIQRFNRLGNVQPIDDSRQGMLLPNIEFDRMLDLEDGWGRLRLNGEVLGVRRGDDQLATYAGVPYVYGYEGNKLHGMVEGSWENQYILPAGLAVTPYLGLRLDGASFDRTTGPIPVAVPPYPNQSDAMLFSATPIAAIDMRWPLMASDGANAHLIEPIAQVVYRGSNTTAVGITNDDAHSFVFDTSNLFSYNRFSGIDRQETGLRANIGGHYLGTFEDGSWIDLVAGQSFHLAGVNALGISDPVQVGTSTGLENTASFIVASARGGFTNGLQAGAKVQVDPSAWRITRAGVGGSYTPPSWFRLGAEYTYLAAEPALGVTQDQHEVTGTAAVTIADYYTLSGGLTWDINGMSWVKANTGLTYNDGYLVLGGTLDLKPAATGVDWRVGVRFQLNGPDGSMAF